MTASHHRDRLADQTIDATIEGETVMASGFRTMKTVRLRHATLDGASTIGPIDREYVEARPAVAVLAYDPARDVLIVIRQFRIGALVANATGAPVELPAGLLDEGETPEAAALRELSEETGASARAAERCFSILPSPGVSDERITFVLAIVDTADLPKAAGLEAEDEDIRPIAAPLADLVEALDEGRFSDGHLVTGLNWFARKGRARAQALVATLDPADA